MVAFCFVDRFVSYVFHKDLFQALVFLCVSIYVWGFFLRSFCFCYHHCSFCTEQVKITQ